MTSDVKSFVSYLGDMKKTSRNMEISCQRNLIQLASFLEDKGIAEVEKVTKTSLNLYIPFLGKEGKATTAISRELASMKAFFNFIFKEGQVRKDPAELLKVLKVEKKVPVILSVNEVNALLDQPGTTASKEIWDKAVPELLYAMGVRVSELIGLELSDPNIRVGYIICRDRRKERVVPSRKSAKQALNVYLERGRHELLKGKGSQQLLTNYSGRAMSHQDFWKIVRYYGEKAGVQADITPHILCHSSAAHLIRGGADIHAVQAMLGRSDSTTTHMHATYSGSMVGETYRAVLPRKWGRRGNHVLMSPNKSCPFGGTFLLWPRAAVTRWEVRVVVCGCCQDGAAGEPVGTTVHILPGVSPGIGAGEWREYGYNPESPGGWSK